MDVDLITQLGSLGVGAVLAVVVIYWKRTDDQRYAQAIKEEADRHVAQLIELVNDSNRRFDLMLEAFSTNTQALNEVKGMLAQQDVIEASMRRLESKIDAIKNGE